MNEQPLICGIDLGTTNSCLAVLIDGKPHVVNIDGSPTMPSVLARQGGQWVVGKTARNHLWVAPSDGVASIKRKMDDAGYRVEIGGQILSPIDVSAKILTALVSKAEQQLDRKIGKTVITVPAWFHEQQRQATLEAGKLAGLDVLHIVNEPTAAAIAHEEHALEDDSEERWLIYDLGGGTFDVSLLSVTAASYEVLASAGNAFLGGDDFDHRLVERFIVHLRDQHNVDASDDLIAMARLQLLAEQAKITLSQETHVHLKEPINVHGQSYPMDFAISRAEFEALIQDLVDSTEEKVAQVLAEAQVKPEELQKLLLVGGSTRIPFVSERLEKRFDRSADNWLDPDLSVAMGACIRAAIDCGALIDRSVVDICPHSLGIAAYGEEDDKAEHDESYNTHPLTFVPLIRRNSRLPARFVRSFFKSFPGQEMAHIAVYQGEHSDTRKNHFIGEFTVQFSQDGSAELDVSFTYDINGTIKIGVREGGGGTERLYSMHVSRSAEENSELGDLSNTFLAMDEDDEDLTESNTAATNYLMEKVNEKLSQLETDAPDIRTLLDRYQGLLQTGDNDDEMDRLEDQLYEWVETD